MRKTILSLSLMAVLLCLVSACNTVKPDKEAIVGIWHVVDYHVGPVKMGDDKCWFEFKADGKMATRADVFAYEFGTWELDEKTKVLKMRDADAPADAAASELGYEVKGDSLHLFETKSAMPYLLDLHCVRTTKYPITKEEEMAAVEMGTPIVQDSTH